MELLFDFRPATSTCDCFREGSRQHHRAMSSQSKLKAPFQTPKVEALRSRKHGSEASGEDGPHKKRFVQPRAPSKSDGGSSSDDDEAMSDSQLKRHSNVAVSEPNGNKLLDAKLERMVMKSNAAQHKENRMHPLPAQSTYGSSITGSSAGSSGARYLMCMWRAPQTRKHKTWDGDACLILGSSSGNKLIDSSNKQM